MQGPQFQASHPQAVQSNMMQAPQKPGKGNTFGNLAKLAFGAITGDPMSAISGGVGLLGGAGGGGEQPGFGQSQTGTAGQGSGFAGAQASADIPNQDNKGVPPLPQLGDSWDAQMWGQPLIQQPPQPQSVYSGMPNLWINRMGAA